MSKPILKSRKLRYGSVTVVLTALIIAATVLFNAIFFALAVRYLWYADMTSSLSFTVSDDCYEYIDTYIKPEINADTRITFLFCDDNEHFDNLSSSTDSTAIVQKYILKTARDLAARYDFIDIEYLNIWIHPGEAKKYGITASTDVAVVCGERFATFKLSDFFTFKSDNTSTPVAYNGESRFAVGLMSVTQSEHKTCYFTLNHGEALYDVELLRTVIDAGYIVNYLDLLNMDIPEDCDLLISFNALQDFTVNDGVSKISETEKLDKYLANGGKMMIFTSADTFVSGARENMEKFLAGWGVEFRHHKDDASGVEFCANIKDPFNALSTDGYTILGSYTDKGLGAEALETLRSATYTPVPVFANSGCIDISGSFVSDGNGNYKNSSTGRTISPMLTSESSAEAWEGGKVADTGKFNLMTLSKGGENDNGAYLLVCSSVSFAAESSLQSAVFGNSGIILSAIRAMGKENVPVKLTFKPFDDTTIDSITTNQSTIITLVLTIVPAALIFGTGIFIMVRRKNS